MVFQEDEEEDLDHLDMVEEKVVEEQSALSGVLVEAFLLLQISFHSFSKPPPAIYRGGFSFV